MLKFEFHSDSVVIMLVILLTLLCCITSYAQILACFCATKELTLGPNLILLSIKLSVRRF